MRARITGPQSMGQEPCNTGLSLGLGGGVDVFAASNRVRRRQQKPSVQFHVLFPPCAKEEAAAERVQLAWEEQGIKRVRLRASEEGDDDAVGRGANEGSCCNGNGDGGTRKKLRLTKEQSTLLENTFREHHTLNPIQKQELAEKLNLRSRQVEVWFQNRRARTKLKQTEVDLEFLKKCCESLSDENRRLKKELQDLRTTKPAGPPLFMIPKAGTLAMCPSCERISAGDGKVPAGVEAKPVFHDCAIKDSSIAC